MLAWERFLTGEPFAQTPTRNFVVSSWLRSCDFGIDPTARAAPIVRDTDVLEELRRRHRELISAAHAVFQEAEGLLGGTRSILLAHGRARAWFCGRWATPDAGCRADHSPYQRAASGGRARSARMASAQRRPPAGPGSPGGAFP